MIIQDLNLNKQLFTAEELKTIEALLNSGQSQHIMSALINIDPEKEAELQRVINKMSPINDGFESEVKKKMDKKLPNGPQTPEEEAYWDRLLQEEYKQYLASQEENRKNIENSLQKKENVKDDVSTTNKEKASPEASSDPTIDDLMKSFSEKKALFDKIKDDPKKKEELKSLKKEIKLLEKELNSTK